MSGLLRRTSRWLPAAVAGVALGAVGWVLFRERALGWSDAEAPPVDLTALRRTLRAAGAEGLEVRSLGSGIVELVGRVDDAVRRERLLAVAGDQPGVSVVVNRLWSPTAEASRRRGSDPEPGSGAELT